MGTRYRSASTGLSSSSPDKLVRAARESEDGRERRVENGGAGTKDSYTIGEVVARLRPEFPTLSVSKIRYLERRRLINLSRTRGGDRALSKHDIEVLWELLSLPAKEHLPFEGNKKSIDGGAPLNA